MTKNQKILLKVEKKFGGMLCYDDNNKLFAIQNCNGFETVAIVKTDYGEYEEEGIEVSGVIPTRVDEINNFIEDLL